jgi:hypothetical protein
MKSNEKEHNSLDFDRSKIERLATLARKSVANKAIKDQV